MKTTLLLVAALFLAPALSAQSYERLKGRRLAQFTKTSAKSESGRLVSLRFPASVLAKATLSPGRLKGRVSFDWKSVSFEVEKRNTYWQQTLRKLKKDSKGELIIKGQVRARKLKDDKIEYYLLIATIQKTNAR